MYIKKTNYDIQDNKGQHLEDGRDAFQKQEVSSHQVPHGNADSLCLSPPAWNPSVLLYIYLFSSWMLDINFPKSCHNMSSRGIPQLQQNDPVSMKWMDKEIKHRDFSQCFFCGCLSSQRSPDSDFHSVASTRKMRRCRWRLRLFAPYI